MKFLVTNKMAFFNELSRIQFEYNMRFINNRVSSKEKELLENYLKTSNKYVLACLEDLVSEDSFFIPKLDIYKNEIKIVDEPINKSDLQIFRSIINSEFSDRNLRLYRGTSKLHFSATNLINNDPNLRFEDLKLGDIVKPISCLSTSLNPFIAVDFCCGGPDNYLLVEFDIIPDGIVFWAAPFSKYFESEMIIASMTSYVVTELEHMDLSFNDIHTTNDKSINYLKLEMRR